MSSVGGCRPLKIASSPERLRIPNVTEYALSFVLTQLNNYLSLMRPAEYQNKEARRTVAAPSRRPAGVALYARQFSFERCLLRLSAASLRAKFTAAKGFSFVPIFEDLALVLCFRARTAINLGLLRSRT
ncbi:hypothetical protein KGM_204218 [Danaus plexippus plexippus]|uniref:Uncharacterized protein n=1 Tax=Danaus plexippus plexippus TaxID=278856 RepID=A0A212EP70_DANPL|nr:hypothetical protein KGM_204218 [Danaus plexippus plexippus]